MMVGVVAILRRPVGVGMVGTCVLLLVDCVLTHCNHQSQQHQEQEDRKEDMRAQEAPPPCWGAGHDDAAGLLGLGALLTLRLLRGPVYCAVGFPWFSA
jgi:hypothetical protein